MTTKLEIPEGDFMHSGHVGCPGCGAAIATRLVLKGLREQTVMVLPACCSSAKRGFPPCEVVVLTHAETRRCRVNP